MPTIGDQSHGSGPVTHRDLKNHRDKTKSEDPGNAPLIALNAVVLQNELGTIRALKRHGGVLPRGPLAVQALRNPVKITLGK